VGWAGTICLCHHHHSDLVSFFESQHHSAFGNFLASKQGADHSYGTPTGNEIFASPLPMPRNLFHIVDTSCFLPEPATFQRIQPLSSPKSSPASTAITSYCISTASGVEQIQVRVFESRPDEIDIAALTKKTPQPPGTAATDVSKPPGTATTAVSKKSEQP